MAAKWGYILEPYLFLSVVSIVMQIFSQQYLLLRSSCLYQFSESVCKQVLSGTPGFEEEERRVQSEAAKWNFIGNSGYATCSILASMVYGTLGDVLNNRKAVLVILAMGSVISGILLISMAAPMTPLSLLWMCVIYQLVSGILGGIVVLLMMSNSYLSLVVREDRRTRRFSCLESALISGILVGPLLAGTFLQKIGFLSTACIATGVVSIAVLYSIFVLRRPRDPENTSYKQWGRLLPHRIAIGMYGIFAKRRQANKSVKLRLVILVCFLGTVILTGANSLLYVYLRKSPYSLSDLQVGIYNALQCGIQFAGLIVLQRLLKMCERRITDYHVIIAGIIGKTGYYLALAFARSKAGVAISLCFSVLTALDAPAIRSLLTKQINSGEQGRVFGMLSSIQAFGYLCSQLITMPIYRRTLRWFAGFVFVVFAILLVVKMTLILVIRHLDTDYTSLENSADINDQTDDL